MLRSIILCLAFSTALCAQLSVAFSDATVAGNPVELLITAPLSGAVEFADGCMVDEVRQGSMSGPVVWTESICPDILISIPAGTTHSFTWLPEGQSGAPLLPDTYALKLTYRDIAQSYAFQTQWVTVVLVAPSAPRLFSVAAPEVGASARLVVDAPLHAGAFYVCAAALSATTGANLGGGILTALDDDLLLQLTLFAPGTLGETGFAGVLGGDGLGPVIDLPLPDAPLLVGRSLHFQAVVYDGNLTLTNLMSLTIADGD